MAALNENDKFDKSLDSLKDQFPLLNVELIIETLLENNCNLEATTKELLLYNSPPSPPKVYQQPKPLPTIEVTGNYKSSGDLRYITRCRVIRSECNFKYLAIFEFPFLKIQL